jgi:cobalamin biosynthesis Mg chelatase CobN
MSAVPFLVDGKDDKGNNAKVSLWDCTKPDGTIISNDLPIWWGHDNNSAEWACNNWIPQCNQSCKAVLNNCNNKTLLDANPQLASACSCRKASNALIKQSETYQTSIQDWTKRLDEHQNSTAKLNRWTQKIGEYNIWAQKENELRDEKKQWNSCVVWNETQSGKHDDWCRNDIGSGWYHSGQSKGPCTPGWGRGVCQRTNDQIQLDLNNAGYAAAKPNVSPHPGAQPSPPGGNNVQCCSQLFQNITAADVKFSEIIQQCTQQINNQIDAALNTTTTQQPTTQQQPTKQLSTTQQPTTQQATKQLSTTQSTAELEKNNQIIIIIIVILILLCISISIIIFSMEIEEI